MIRPSHEEVFEAVRDSIPIIVGEYHRTEWEVVNRCPGSWSASADFIGRCCLTKHSFRAVAAEAIDAVEALGRLVRQTIRPEPTERRL